MYLCHSEILAAPCLKEEMEKLDGIFPSMTGPYDQAGTLKNLSLSDSKLNKHKIAII